MHVQLLLQESAQWLSLFQMHDTINSLGYFVIVLRFFTITGKHVSMFNNDNSSIRTVQKNLAWSDYSKCKHVQVHSENRFLSGGRVNLLAEQLGKTP